jgi:hypothetical protein
MIPRKHPRFTVQFPAFFTRDRRVKGDIANVSLEGCCLHNVESGVRVKGILTLYLELSGREPPLRVDSAQVRWHAASNFGVKFLFMEKAEQRRLEQYITQLASANTPTDAAFRIPSPLS